MAVTAGTRIGRYEVRSRLGAGGMAEVYLALDTQLGRRVALKILPPDTSADEHARKRLVREARAAATLDHPSICSVYEVGEADGRTFIAMQYVEGETLEARLARGPLEEKDALAIAVDVVDALGEAHAHGILHRDVKPSNIMITARHRAKVMDFGLAKLMPEAAGVAAAPETASLLSADGAVMGTIPYMSPEQVRGEALDARSDLFSAGVVIYEMLCGCRPFQAKSMAATAAAILAGEPLPMAQLAPHVPVELERIVGRLLRKDPRERYQSAADLLRDLSALRDEEEFRSRLGSRPPSSSTVPAPSSRASARRFALIAIAMLVIGAAAGWWMWSAAKVRRARALVPRIEALADAQRYFDAYDLAVTAEPYVPGDPTLVRLMPTISQTMSVITHPAGANVYLERFAPDAAGHLPPRRLVGTTPLSDLRVARGEYVLSIEKDGYAPTERTISGRFLHAEHWSVTPPPVRIDQALLAKDLVPPRMVFVPGGEYRLVAWSRPTDLRVHLDDYFIDKYEVTNQEFKEFIDAGGYLKREFWKHPFADDRGRPVPWDDAMRRFTDRTGLAGPRSWSGQNIPEGKADYPVTDISWYEAEAYAAFRGKQLPTVFQWEKAARNGASSPLTNYMPWGAFYPGDTLEHRANFMNNGTLPVTSSEFGMSPFGCYNMAGNVSEWTRNESSEGFIATGGAWGEPTYVFAEYGMRPGFYSSAKLGFRCARTVAAATGDQGAARIEVKREIPHYKPSSDADFLRLAAAYEYAKSPPDAHVVETVATPEWKREKITFLGAGGERAIAYLYLPNNFPRPLSVVHFVPAANVDDGLRPLTDAMNDRLAPIIKSGRAAFGVVLKGYVERLQPEGYVDIDPGTVEYLEKMVGRITDLRRGLDYLETRPDIDAGRVAFFGPSAGAQIGLILAAIEPRYRTVVFAGAGLTKDLLQYVPAANPIHFVSHIRAPKLLIQGRYDEDIALRTEAEPLFALLPEPKRLVLYDGGHVAPTEFLVSTVTAWLDETLGPVRR